MRRFAAHAFALLAAFGAGADALAGKGKDRA